MRLASFSKEQRQRKPEFFQASLPLETPPEEDVPLRGPAAERVPERIPTLSGRLEKLPEGR